MEQTIKILMLIINPWVIFGMLIIVLFRTEIKSILQSITNFTDNLHEIKFKSLKLTSAQRSEIAAKFKATTVQTENAMSTETPEFQMIASGISNTLSDDDLSIFMNVFSDDETAVISNNSRHEGSFYRLKDSGAITLRQLNLPSNTKSFLQEWNLTRAGKELREAMKSYI